MSEAVKIKVKMDLAKARTMQNNAMECLFDLAYDIASQARANAPYVTGALRNSVRVEPDGENVLVKAGGTVAPTAGIGAKRIDYAVKREYGPNRDPATEHYMENARKQIMSGDYLEKYFGEVSK